MGKLTIILLFSINAKAASDLYLDIYHSKTPGKSIVVMEYRGCVDVLEVETTDIEQENEILKKDPMARSPIAKWMHSHKKMRDAQAYDCKK